MALTRDEVLETTALALRYLEDNSCSFGLGLKCQVLGLGLGPQVLGLGLEGLGLDSISLVA